MEQDISGDELHSILSEIDTNQNGQVELDEYLQVSSDIVRILTLFAIFLENGYLLLIYSMSIEKTIPYIPTEF